MISFLQGAFVLCRLFKKAEDIKQDDNDDASHSDEVETNVLSPNPTNISQEEIRSEPAVVQASPVSVEQSVEQQVVSEHCAVKPSDSITSETMYPARPPMNEEMTHEVSIPIKPYPFQSILLAFIDFGLTFGLVCRLTGGFTFQ